MMRCPSFCLLATLLCVLISCCSADEDTRPLYEVDDVFGPELAFRGDREKKAVELKLASGFGIKNFLLDLVFGKVNQVIDYKTQLVKNLDRTNRYKNYYLLGLGTPPKGAEHPAQGGAGGGGGGYGGGGSMSSTTEEIPVLDGSKVNLDLPPMLFASGFSLVTNVSKVISDIITNTAKRTQRFVEAFKPLLGKFLHIETGNDRVKREDIPASIARLAEDMELKAVAKTQLESSVVRSEENQRRQRTERTPS